MKTSILLVVLLIGQIFAQYNIGRYSYADVIYMVDESGMNRNDIVNFLSNFMPKVEQTLINAGLGGSGSGSNNYGLILFGSSQHSTPYSVQFNGGLLVESGQFISQAINELSSAPTTGNYADGWAAIDTALGYPLRPNSFHKFILITPRYRQIVNPSLNRNDLISRLLQQKIVLNVIVNASYVQPTETSDNMMLRTMGLLYYGQQRISVVLDSLQIGQNFTAGGRILGPMSSFTTVDDYIFLVQQLAREQCSPSRFTLAGSSWDYKFVLHGGQDVELFIQGHLNTLNIEVTPSLLSTLPITQPGIPFPGTNQCPFSQYNPIMLNNNLYFMVNGAFNLAQAKTTCIQQHAQLAIIQTIEDGHALQSITNPVWIGSYNGQSNDVTTGPYHAFHSGQMIVVQSTDTFSTLCFISSIPETCRSIPTVRRV